MISRHSFEQTENGEGVETVVNVPCEDPVHGKGQFTEKRIHISRYDGINISTTMGLLPLKIGFNTTIFDWLF